MNEADYWRLAHNALQARYDDLLQRVASGQMLVSAPQITVDVMSLSDDLKRQTLIALGWTPPDAKPFAYIPTWVPARLDKYNHVTGHITKNVGDKADRYMPIYRSPLP